MEGAEGAAAPASPATTLIDSQSPSVSARVDGFDSQAEVDKEALIDLIILQDEKAWRALEAQLSASSSSSELHGPSHAVSASASGVVELSVPVLPLLEDDAGPPMKRARAGADPGHAPPRH